MSLNYNIYILLIGLISLGLAFTLRAYLAHLAKSKFSVRVNIAQDEKLASALDRLFSVQNAPISDTLTSIEDLRAVAVNETANAVAPFGFAYKDRPKEHFASIENKKIERKLQRFGIFYDWQIASWTPENAHWIGKKLKMKPSEIMTIWIPNAKQTISHKP